MLFVKLIFYRLSASVEHVISIGDHEQLRPSTNNYNLSLESQAGAPYKLDRSQFERLSVGEPGRLTLPVAQLSIQRRMRPEISRLIKTIYPRLVDHNTTEVLPHVVGMRDNVSNTYPHLDLSIQYHPHAFFIKCLHSM